MKKIINKSCTKKFATMLLTNRIVIKQKNVNIYIVFINKSYYNFNRNIIIKIRFF